MEAKIAIKSDKIMPFGGIFSVICEFSSIERLIDSELGRRVKAVGYQYGEIMRTMMCNYMCGGDRMEDIKVYQPGIEYMPGMKLCSPDTVLRAIDELTVANTTYVAESGKSYAFNISEKLNTLMVKAAMRQGMLRLGRQYILDFDHKFIEAEKYDAKFSYRGERGYMPGVSVLTDMATGDDVIVGVENRDGNTNVKFHQADTLERTFKRIEANGLWAAKVRCDCGSYSREIIETISRHCHKFYIRANMYGALRDSLAEHTNWEKVDVDGQETEALSLPFISIEGINHCRLVVQRSKKDTPDLFDGQYVYRAILTNDWDDDEAEIISFYNQRGAKEKIF
ncbi:MAG: IS1380 family transposase, partial [Muribaculaceae bacterium]|nr:IS1380 family transposase [Muribaculaceae bacterium]